MVLRNDIRAIILDFDNTLYRDPEDLREIFRRSLAKASIEHGFTGNEHDAIEVAARSYVLYGNELALFFKDHGISPNVLAPAAYGNHLTSMKDRLSPSKELTNSFNALSKRYELLILSHATQKWIDEMVHHLGFAPFLKPDRAFGINHPKVDRAQKDHGTKIFKKMSSHLGVHTGEVAVIEDSVANLRYPKTLGMQTILVDWGTKPIAVPDYVDVQIRSIADLCR